MYFYSTKEGRIGKLSAGFHAQFQWSDFSDCYCPQSAIGLNQEYEAMQQLQINKN